MRHTVYCKYRNTDLKYVRVVVYFKLQSRTARFKDMQENVDVEPEVELPVRKIMFY